MRALKVLPHAAVAAVCLFVVSEAAAQKPKPKRAAPAPAARKAEPPAPSVPSVPMGTLLVICDRDCLLLVDGKRIGDLKAAEGKNVPAAVGQHLVHAETAEVAWEQIIELKSAAQLLVKTDLNGELWKIQEAERQAEAARLQAEEAARLEQQRQAEYAEQQRQAELRRQEEARQAELRRQEEARQAAVRQQQEAERARREQEARLAAERAAREAAQRFWTSVAGTWVRSDDQQDRQNRTHIDETVVVSETCAGALERTTTHFERGFSGWRKTGTDVERNAFQCDGSGALSGELSGRIAPVNENQLTLGANMYTRK